LRTGAPLRAERMFAVVTMMGNCGSVRNDRRRSGGREWRICPAQGIAAEIPQARSKTAAGTVY
jgi:hypothetical protein